MQAIFPATAARLEEWKAQPGVLGVLLVGSKSLGHNDALSDDDLEVLLTDEAFAQIAPAECGEVFVEGEGAARKLIYDVQYTAYSSLQQKSHSHHDLDHWPYERAGILFDRDGRVQAAVAAAARMDPAFRHTRLLHSTIDAWVAPRRAAKTLQRGADCAGRMIISRGAKALARVLFALEERWVPLDHWLEAELRTLDDPAQAGVLLCEAVSTGDPAPLEAALNRLEDRLFAEGVPRASERRALFYELLHPSRASERAIHGLY
jgi:hypothetical protein